MARTLHVYDFPTVRPVTVIARCAGSVTVFVPVAPPFADTHPAVNPVNALPLLPLAVYATRNCPGFGRVTPVSVGAGGEPTITAPDAAENGPGPTAFVARTLHVYDLPVVAPVTVTGDAAPDPIRAAPPFDEVHETPKEVIGLPPVAVGAANDTVSEPVAVVVEPERVTTEVGEPGRWFHR